MGRRFAQLSTREDTGMIRVVNCLTLEHDLRLVLLAACVCAVGALATATVARRATDGGHPRRWLALLSACAGATVWSTHFIAMLAYKTSVPMTYAPLMTAMSLVAGTVVIGLGFAISIRGRHAARRRLLGGATVGAGVVLLHYVGMAALRFPGHINYDADLIAASIALSVGLGAGAAQALFGPQRAHSRISGATLLVAMTVALHFTAMGAAQLNLGLSVEGASGGLSRTVLAGAVSIASIGMLLIGLAGAMIDQRISQRLAAEAERFRTLADGAFEGLVVHRDGAIVDANSAACRIFGFDDEPTRYSIDAWIDPVTGDDLRAWTEHDAATREVVLRRADGSSFPAEICRRRMMLPDGSDGELLAIRDLTARKESEARIAHLALHDPLTDLPNRRFFVELANKSIANAQRTSGPFALLALDLDGFKVVNDVHGHVGGDELLREVTARIGAALRESDVVARLGGDEFAVLQSSASQPKQSMSLAQRLLDVLREPIRVGHAEVSISVSIGVALYPSDGATVEELLRNADTALYRAKADGKATCRFFEADMDDALDARRRLEARLRRAIVEERLTLAYQPIVDSESRQPLGFEALVRWHDEEMGAISPVDFIPVAEETGLIVPLGEFVLREACRTAAAWPSPLRVAVNLSAVQFRRKGLVDTVRRALDESGLPGRRLELEVTETLLIENRDDALAILSELKALDVRIAMDDFGTGYSSLSYLKSFPFDKIKIDRVFVSDLQDDTENACIVQAVTSMGKSLRMRVVAEGVETDGQAELLRDLRCDELQGFLIARPMPAAEVESFLGDGAVTPPAEPTIARKGEGPRLDPPEIERRGEHPEPQARAASG